MADWPTSGAVWRWRFENVEFDESRMVLLVAGQPTAIEPKPLQLLGELLRHVNEAVTRDELFEALWAGQDTADHVLASAVNRLRKALGPVAAARLVTLPRIGYRLNGPVERLAANATPAVTAAWAPGQLVPMRAGFRLEQRLGHGSGGDVWLARHATLGEARVFKFATTPEQLRALKREFTLHRLLRAELGDIEGLAPLLDAQLAEPPFHLESPWLGLDLPRWAAQRSEWEAMTPDDRITFLLPAVHALAQAHAVGVLHKDIKPSNILIAGAPGAWRALLADFGSGLAHNPERLRQLGLTALGLTVTDQDAAARAGGTVLYLAPELLAGRAATVQSDLYALGLVLYQTVVGQFTRPLSGSWQDDIACELLRDDIALATAADPARRLSSVRELFDRLRLLPQRRDERRQQLQREQARQQADADWARRRARRPWVWLGTAGLVLGLLGSLAALQQASQQRQKAEAAAARAASIVQFLHRDVLESASIVSMGAPFRATSLLDVARKASRSAGERFGDQPRVEGEIRRRLTETYILLAAFPDADADSARAVELLSASGPADDEQLLLARFERARLHVWRERPALAQRELEAAEAAMGAARLSGSDFLAFAAVRARALYTSHIVNRPKLAHMKTPQAQAAWVPLARRELALADALHASHGTDRVAARQALAVALWWTGERKGAESILDELTRPPFNHTAAPAEFRARYLQWEGTEFQRLGRHEDAVARFESGIAVLRQAGTGVNEFSLAWLEFEAGRAQWMAARGTDALQTLSSSQGRMGQLLGPEHHYISMIEAEMGDALVSLRRPAEALRRLESSEAADQRLLGRKRRQVPNAIVRAMAYNDLGQGEEALRWLDGIDRLEAEKQTGLPAIGALLDHERGQALVLLGRAPEGQPLKARAAQAERAYSLGPALARRIGAPATPPPAPAADSRGAAVR